MYRGTIYRPHIVKEDENTKVVFLHGEWPRASISIIDQNDPSRSALATIEKKNWLELADVIHATFDDVVYWKELAIRSEADVLNAISFVKPDELAAFQAAVKQFRAKQNIPWIDRVF